MFEILNAGFHNPIVLIATIVIILGNVGFAIVSAATKRSNPRR
jgi:Trk-type K+ transport system membrane component